MLCKLDVNQFVSSPVQWHMMIIIRTHQAHVSDCAQVDIDEVLGTATPFYYQLRTSLAAFVNTERIATWFKTPGARFAAVSITPKARAEAACVSPDGRLTLVVGRDAYERIGLTGTLLPAITGAQTLELSMIWQREERDVVFKS